MELKQLTSLLTGCFLASPCPLCQRSGTDLFCTACLRQLQDQRLVASTSESIVAWGTYGGLLKQSLTLLKYGDRSAIGLWLGQQLGQTWYQIHGARFSTLPVVVPIPLHPQRLAQRGYNQAALIAQGFCQVARLPLLEHGLVRTKDTQAQHRLGLEARQANLSAAFHLGPGWRPRLRQGGVILIDDIYTTGVTVRSAAQVLARSGLETRGVAVVARALLERPDREPAVAELKPGRRHQRPATHQDR